MTKPLSAVHPYESFLAQYSVHLSSAQHLLLERFLDELLLWNRAFNLTGLRCKDKIVRHLILDSLVCASKLPQTGNLLDIGSGAGFPAIPIKIYSPSLNVRLLEPNRKRANFLKHIKRLLSFDEFEVLRQTVQEHCTEHRAFYHVLTARAVMDPPKVFRWAVALLKPRGTLALFLGRQAGQTMALLNDKGNQLGMVLSYTSKYQLPGIGMERCLCLFEKCAE